MRIRKPKILFLHQNMPGQFWRIASHIAREDLAEVLFMTRRRDRSLPGVRRINYDLSREPNPSIHPYLRQMEEAVLHGQAVARACVDLARSEPPPDLVIAHPGWGEALFIKDVWPDTRLISYAEYFDTRAQPEDPALLLNARARIRMAMAHMHLSLSSSDAAWTPMEWQKRSFPRELQDKIEVIHDGVATKLFRPDPAVRLTLADGRVLDRSVETITFVARGLEPLRGFDQLARALPEILERRPSTRVLIVGEDRSYYARQPESGSWIGQLLPDLGRNADRVIFAGRLDYADYVQALQLSSLHLYLSEPFVVSWSFMEAMSTGVLMLARESEAVLEVIRPDVNGLVWRSEQSLAAAIDAAFERPDRESLAAAAQQTIAAKYALEVCLPQHLRSIQNVLRR